MPKVKLDCEEIDHLETKQSFQNEREQHGKELQKLTEKYQASLIENNKLRQELNSLVEDIAKLEINHEPKHFIEQQRKQIIERENELSQCISRFNELKESNDLLAQKIVESEAQVNLLNDKLNSLDVGAEKHESENMKCNEMTEHLKQENHELIERIKELQPIQGNDSMNSTLYDTLNTTSLFNNSGFFTSEGLANVVMMDQKQLNSDLKEEIVHLQNTIATQSSEFENEFNSVTELNGRLEIKINDLKSENDKFSESNSKYAIEVAEMRNQINDMQAALDKNENELKLLITRHNTVITERNLLEERKIEQKDSQKKQEQIISGKPSSIECQKLSLQEACQKAKAETANHQQEYQTVLKKKEEVAVKNDEYFHEIVKLEDQIATLNSENKELIDRTMTKEDEQSSNNENDENDEKSGKLKEKMVSDFRFLTIELLH